MNSSEGTAKRSSDNCDDEYIRMKIRETAQAIAQRCIVNANQIRAQILFPAGKFTVAGIVADAGRHRHGSSIKQMKPGLRA